MKLLDGVNTEGNYYFAGAISLYFVTKPQYFMKTKFTLLLAVVLTLNASGSTHPQMQSCSKVFSVNNFGNFNVHRQHNSAALSWVFNSPNVSKFLIQRSYDGSNFSTIDEQGLSSGHWNKYLDLTVEPGTIYYRVIAIMDDNTREESPVAEVRIVRHR